MTKVSLTNKFDGTKMVQKGPAPDYSMLLEMKRRGLLVKEADAAPAGRKGTGAVVDTQHTRGFTSGVVSVFAARGARLGFFRF